MIEYDFQIDNNEVTRCFSKSPLVNIDQTSLAHCYFFMPTVLIIDGKNLFADVDQHYSCLTFPLIAMSTTGSFSAFSTTQKSLRARYGFLLDEKYPINLSYGFISLAFRHLRCYLAPFFAHP